MEREIKFRAKSKTTNKFVYGIPIKTHIGTYMVYEENPHVCSMYGYMEIDGFELIDENTIGQFSRRKDKNSKDIYDGDIIERYNWHQDWETGEIEFKLEQFIVKFEEGSFGVYETIPDAKYLSEILDCEVSELSEEELKYVGLKVIGNIYDTPELIDE